MTTAICSLPFKRLLPRKHIESVLVSGGRGGRGGHVGDADLHLDCFSCVCEQLDQCGTISRGPAWILLLISCFLLCVESDLLILLLSRRCSTDG